MIKNIIGLAVVLTCTGCMSVSSDVNSFSAPTFDPQAVHVIVASTPQQQDSVEFAEYSMQATRALTLAGINVNNTSRNPEIAVIMDYGQKEAGVTSSTHIEKGRPTLLGELLLSKHEKDKTKDHSNMYDLLSTDDEETTTTTINYSKFVTLTAVRFSDLKFGRAQQIWKVDVNNERYNNSLREMMPFMLSSAVPYMGRSSGAEITVRVPADEDAPNYILTGFHK